jgi:hypothetical protein
VVLQLLPAEEAAVMEMEVDTPEQVALEVQFPEHMMLGIPEELEDKTQITWVDPEVGVQLDMVEPVALDTTLRMQQFSAVFQTLTIPLHSAEAAEAAVEVAQERWAAAEAAALVYMVKALEAWEARVTTTAVRSEVGQVAAVAVEIRAWQAPICPAEAVVILGVDTAVHKVMGAVEQEVKEQ